MAKNELTDETLVDKCTCDCKYNEKGFCHLHTIMINEDGKCIYLEEASSNGKDLGQ